MAKTAFYAFPDARKHVADAIANATELTKDSPLSIHPWPKMDIFGIKIDDQVRNEIEKADFLLADVSYPNPNVYYEIGYAIGIEKPILPTLHDGIEKAVQRVQEVGLFDTIGWLTYENGESLADKLSNLEISPWTNNYKKPRDYSQPLFILDTFKKTDFRNQIFHGITNSHVHFRNFDPTESSRLSVSQAIGEVSSSAGIILPIVGKDIYDQKNHNLRAAFLLGLAHGFKVETLVLQYDGDPVPLDFRDFVTNTTHRTETEKHVANFCQNVLVWNQSRTKKNAIKTSSFLGRMNLGSPAAENEINSLSEYFIPTAQFSRTLRAEGAVVSGRKGSGKSAIFFQALEKHSENRRSCVVDLRPASHNLSELREQILGVAAVGIFDHTIASFWQYIILTEVLLKIREKLLPLARNDFDLQNRIRSVEEKFHLTEEVVSGDFTSRLKIAISNALDALDSCRSPDELRRKITNVMFVEPIPNLRNAILDFSDSISDVVVMIDDLDKGWPARQVERHDVLTVKHLIESLNKIRREFGRRNLEFKHMLFLRSDIYEKLVEETSDRGKYNVIGVDWSDHKQLRHLLEERVSAEFEGKEQEQAWRAFNPPLPSGKDAVEVMIEHSLKRPRFLIDLAEKIISTAVNRGKIAVTAEEVEDGLRQMSLYLVSDFGYELRDIAGTPADIFYAFIGASNRLDEEDVHERLGQVELEQSKEDAIETMLWYGFLGVVNENDEDVFIYDREYDFRRLDAERKRVQGSRVYSINQAFLLGLN